ncbi:MAG: AbrB/MazE/SpoVT family DNA-binding domain-containing protein [Coriobacteriia bacterium]|nr:AbrB/MazE/SpoVT family DNA-binding domain-containing protein [Coriobacteriia bacterium]
MDTVTLSPKYQVVIPKDIRDSLELRPGQKIEAILYDRRIELVPVRPISDMCGFLPGLDSDVPREADRV